jgi:hypothetical protein
MELHLRSILWSLIETPQNGRMEDGPFRVNTICISRWAWKRKEKKTEG